MARPLRICLPGGVYHVISRGNARQRVYRDEFDRLSYLTTLGQTVDRFGWLCHAYCLMDNHYHLVVETPQPNLPRGMRHLNGLYAQRFNRRHRRCGHLFQARYRSILIERESHLLEVCRYAVLNPLRAGICAKPDAYLWSSYLATAGIVPAPAFLCTDWLLGQFGRHRGRAQSSYRAFVAGGSTQEWEAQALGERIGTRPFLRDRFGFDPPLEEIPRAHIEPLRRPLAEIFGSDATAVATAYRRDGYTLREIAEYLGCHYSTVSRRLRSEEELLDCKT